MPSIDEMLMIDPPPAAIIGSIDAWMPRMAPVRLTSITFWKRVMSAVLRGATCTTPALFTSTLSLPKVCTAVSTAFFQSSPLVTSRCT